MFMPVAIDMTGRRVLVVGGGRVAAHKLKCLRPFADEIVVCAPEFSEPVAAAEGATLVRRAYGEDMLDGAGLVYACTDYPIIVAFSIGDARNV